jgi:hypothetical protein
MAFLERLDEVAGLYERTTGHVFAVPADLSAEFIRVDQLAQRYMEKNYQHTEAELTSLKTLCQWSVDFNAKLRGQPTPPPIPWV